MTRWSRSRRFALAAVWLAAAVPMVTLGYGSDADAWTVARTGQRIWETGTYIRSRSSGFPLYELTLAPIVTAGGPVATNLFSVACGLVCIALWLRLAARGVLRHPGATTIAFSFLPIVMINATSTMDYIPGLACLLGAYLAWHANRHYVCALLIGVACGVRPTNALFIVPAVAATYVQTRNVKRALAMLALAVVIGLVVLWPALRLGGFGVPRDVTWLQGAKSASELFGIAQTPVIAGLALWSMGHSRRGGGGWNWSPFDIFHLVNVMVFLGAYALHPGGSGYLLPIVPSVLLLIDRYASRPVAIAACIVMLSYHVAALDVLGTRSGARRLAVVPVSGFTVRDVADRRFKLWLKDAVLTWNGTEPTVLLERPMHPFAADTRWTFDEGLWIFSSAWSAMHVAQLEDDPAWLARLREHGYRVVARREREWEYQRPQSAAGHQYIDFVDDLGALLGSPQRGTPLD